MSLDVVNTIKSTFGSLRTEAGMKVLGLLFVVQLLNMGSSYLGTMGPGMAALSGLIALVTAAAMILITVGAFRSFDSGDVTSDQYTSNIGWPVIRILGANIVTTVFAYGLAVLAVLPAILVLGLGGTGLSLAGATSGATLFMGVIGLIGGVIGIAAFTYMFLMLTVSIPMIAVDDNRVFQALDRSVQRTSGEKLSMFLASLPVAVLYGVGILLLLVSGATMPGQAVSPVIVLLSSALTAVIATLVFSLLNQYHQRLPE